MKRLKIYSDRAYVSPKTPTHCAMMSPFWGAGEQTQWYEDFGIFEPYAASGAAYFEPVERIEDADYVILPSTYHRYVTDGTEQVAHDFADKAAAAGKQIVVFHERDFDFKFPRPNAILFSPNIVGPRGPREFGLPGWVPDHLPEGGVVLRQKGERAVVGFCGWVRRPDARGLLIRFLRMYVPPYNRVRAGSASAPAREAGRHRYLRATVIDILRNAPEIEANFVLRDDFFGGAMKGPKGNTRWDKQTITTAVDDFVANLTGSDYIVCARGDGNFSLRFYETLAFGRIPAFVDTRCVLPYDFAIDWRSEMPWIDARDLAGAPRRIAEFHAALSPEAFRERQLRMRRLWEEWLSPDGFFRNFHRHFEQLPT